MSRILRFALGHFPGSIWVYVGLAVALLAAGGWAGNAARGLWDAPVISAAQKDKALAEKATADETARFNAYQAQVERGRANDAANFEAQRTGLERQIADLSAKQKTADRKAANDHRELLKVLADAPQPPPDAPQLDPSLAAYADRLRDIQAGRDGTAAPARNPD